jgi:hypothetical protein
MPVSDNKVPSRHAGDCAHYWDDPESKITHICGEKKGHAGDHMCGIVGVNGRCFKATPQDPDAENARRTTGGQ